MNAARAMKLNVRAPLRRRFHEDSLPGLVVTRRFSKDDLVWSAPLSSCLLGARQAVPTKQASVVTNHRRKSRDAKQRQCFHPAASLFASSSTIAQFRPRNFELPPLDTRAPSYTPVSDSTLHAAVGLMLASVRYRVSMGLELPQGCDRLLRYLSILDLGPGGAGLGGSFDSDDILSAAMAQYAHDGMGEEMLSRYVIEQVFGNADEGILSVEQGRSPRPTPSSLQDVRVANACRFLFPQAVEVDDGTDLSGSEQQGFVAEILSTCVASGLYDARRVVRWLPVMNSTQLVEAFVPFGSFLQQASSAPNCEIRVNTVCKRVEVVARQRLAPGDELSTNFPTGATSKLSDAVLRASRF